MRPGTSGLSPYEEATPTMTSSPYTTGEAQVAAVSSPNLAGYRCGQRIGGRGAACGKDDRRREKGRRSLSDLQVLSQSAVSPRRHPVTRRPKPPRALPPKRRGRP